MIVKSGTSNLAYVGVQARTPSEWITATRAPTVHDYKDYFVGTFWLQQPSKVLWFLANKHNNEGEWINLNLGGAAGIQTLTGDIGMAVGPDASDNIDILGAAGQLVVTGDPVLNSLTVSLDDAVATSYLADDANSAVPVANVLNVLGDGVLIDTSASGSTLTIGSASSAGNDGEVLIGKTGGLPAWNNITSLDGTVTVTNGPNTIDLKNNAGSPIPSYSTGTFVPRLRFGSSSTGITYTSRWASYTLIGDLCLVNIYIALSSKGTSTGTAYIDDFPFANLPFGTNFVTTHVQGFTFSSNCYEWHSTFNGSSLKYITIGQTYLNGTYNIVAKNTNFADDTILRFYGQYFIV